jgi:hypothetical protein
MEKKKKTKKKGRLGIGNGLVIYASKSDKVSNRINRLNLYNNND